jgi:hypothetical protein
MDYDSFDSSTAVFFGICSSAAHLPPEQICPFNIKEG